MSSALDSLGGLAKSAGIVLVGTILGNLIAISAEILIARSLTPAVYGSVGLAYGIITSIGIFAVLGVPNGVTRFISEGRADQRHVLRSGYAIALIGGVLASLAVYVSRFEIASLMNDARISSLLVAFIPYLVAFPLAKVSVATLRAQKRSTAAVIAQRIGPRVGGLALFVGFFFVGQPVVGAIGYWLAFPVLGTLLALYYVRTEFALGTIIGRLPDRQTLRELWSFSWPLAAGASLFILLSRIDLVMIGYFLDSAAVGYYRSIRPLRQVVLFFSGALSFLYLPLATEHYTRQDISGLDELYTVTTKWIVSLTFPLVLLFTVFSTDIIRLFFGTAYLPAAPALSVLMAGLFFRALVGLDGDMVKAIDRPRIELYSALVGVVVDVVLNAVLIPRFGIVGAALGTIAGYIVYNAVEVAAIYRAVGSHPFSAGALKPLVPTTAVGLIMLYFTAEQVLGLVALAGVGIGLYAAQFLSMVLTRSFTDTDLFLIERFEAKTGIDLTWLTATIRSRT